MLELVRFTRFGALFLPLLLALRCLTGFYTLKDFKVILLGRVRHNIFASVGLHDVYRLHVLMIKGAPLRSIFEQGIVVAFQCFNHCFAI